MKSKEELDALKKELSSFCSKMPELTPDELKEVAGGGIMKELGLLEECGKKYDGVVCGKCGCEYLTKTTFESGATAYGCLNCWNYWFV